MSFDNLPAVGEDWPRVNAAAAGIDEQALADTTEFVRQHNSTAFIVAHADGLVTSEHWHCESGFDSNPMLAPKFTDDDRSLEDVASAQKSVVSVLIGIALAKGLLTPDDTVSSHMGAGWTRADESAESIITIRHLLTMTSGLDHASQFVAPPGSRWFYNLGSAWHTLKRVLPAVTGKPLNDLLDDWLTGPLGMAKSQFVDRPDNPALSEAMKGSLGYPDGKAVEGFVSSALDMARFGLAVCAGGVIGDVDLGIAESYLHESLQPSTSLNPSYGYLWWLNGQAFSLAPLSDQPIDGPLVPSAPDDMVSALGALGRAVYVIPSRRLVVVRLGGSPSEQVIAASKFGRDLFDRLKLD